MSLTDQSRRLAPAALLLALLGAPASAAPGFGYYQPGETTYTRAEVLLQDGSEHPEAAKAGTLPAGASVLLIQKWLSPKRVTWWQVSCDGQTGWLPDTSLTRLAPRPSEGSALAAPPASTPVPVSPAAPVAESVQRPNPDLAEIERAITKQEGRRRSAITGYVIGGVLIFGGVIKSAIDTDNEAQEKYDRGDYSETPLDYTGIAIGVLVAAPIFIAAANTHVDANRELKTLYPARSRLKLAPRADGGQIMVSLEFGGR